MISILIWCFSLLFITILILRKYGAQWCIPPLVMCSLLFQTAIVEFENERGWPVYSPAPDGATVFHTIVQPDYIFFWVRPEGADDLRAFRIPSTKEEREKLHQAKKQQAESGGEMIIMRGKKKDDDKGNEIFSFDYKLRSPTEMMPKDPK